MPDKTNLTQQFIKFDTPFDFNSLALMLSSYNFSSKITSNHNPEYILDSTFQIKNVDKDPKFYSLIQLLNNKFNKEEEYIDMDIFYSTSVGASGITHKDEYSVYILGVCGHTIYKIEQEIFEVFPGDLLCIPPHTTHTAIGMTPRIILSYAKPLESRPQNSNIRYK
jgi:hypothetical protein